MNIENLNIGKEYTYRELCALFGQTEKTHHSRDAQKKEWARYFRWSNPTKQKYLIEEIYDTPLEKTDGRANNGGNSTSKYLSLDDVIMDYFAEQKELTCTLPMLAVKIGILTNQYSEYKNNARQFSEDKQIPEELVGAFINDIRSCVIDAIKAALGRLEKEGYLEVENYIVLVLCSGRKVKIKGEQLKEITKLENQVLEEMGISRVQLYIASNYRDYCLKFKEKVFEKYDYETDYHYREYKIKQVKDNYQDKGKDDIGRLTRKFILTIGYSMLKAVCWLDKEYDQDELIENIIEMSNCFFTYMNSESWDRFWDDEELSVKDERKSLAFWSQYCLVKLQIDSDKREKERRREEKEQRLRTIRTQRYRDEAVEVLGEDLVLEIEYVLPDIDWERVRADEDYTYRCSDAVCEYQDLKYMLYYSKEEHIEDYCLYVARLVKQGKEDEQIPLYEFVKQFE